MYFYFVVLYLFINYLLKDMKKELHVGIKIVECKRCGGKGFSGIGFTMQERDIIEDLVKGKGLRETARKFGFKNPQSVRWIRDKFQV